MLNSCSCSGHISNEMALIRWWMLFALLVPFVFGERRSGCTAGVHLQLLLKVPPNLICRLLAGKPLYVNDGNDGLDLAKRRAARQPRQHYYVRRYA